MYWLINTGCRFNGFHGSVISHGSVQAQIRVRPCSHHRFETGTVTEPFPLPVFTSIPLRPLVPVRADHLAM